MAIQTLGHDGFSITADPGELVSPYRIGFDLQDTLGRYAEGYAAGVGAGAASPTVTVTQNPTNEENAVIFEMYDDLTFAFIELACRDREGGPKLVVYDTDEGFYHPFTGRSSVSGAGTEADPYIFTVYRRGRWPTGIDLDFVIRAQDSEGNLTDTSVTIRC